MSKNLADSSLKKIYKPFGRLCLIYAITIGGFGLFGYISKGSQISLISGGGFGLILLLFSAKLLSGTKWALYGFTATNALLCAVFFIRFLKTKSVYPSLMLFFISVFVLAIAMKITAKAGKEDSTTSSKTP